MNDQFIIISKSDIRITPIFRNFINKYGLYNVFNNKKIINDPNFYILFIASQDYSMYNEVGKQFKLFVFNFIKYICNPTVKDYIVSILDINSYLYISQKRILSLWKYVYNIEPFNKSYNYDIITKTDIKKIINKYTQINKYNYNDVVKFLIFTWYCKYDLGNYIILLESDENADIDKKEILDFINQEKSIFNYVNNSDTHYPLFNSSIDTLNTYVNLPSDLAINNIDPGYLWKDSSLLGNLKTLGLCTNIYDLFFSYLYIYLRNGIVTNNIVAWTYLFGYNHIDPQLLNKLYSIIINIPVSISGLVSDLYAVNNIKAIDYIKNKMDINNIKYTYSQGQEKINIENIFNGLPNELLHIIAEKDFEPTGYFSNFGIDINKINFNNNFFFNILISNNPMSIDINTLNDKINLYKEESYSNYYIKIYNTLSYLNSKNDFEIVIDYEFKVINNINDDNIKYFNLSILKQEIITILFNEYSFIPDTCNSNLKDQYANFINKKKDISNILKCLLNDEVYIYIKNIINDDIYLKLLFYNI